MEINTLKLFLKIDSDEDDPIITIQMKAASAYIKKAGVIVDTIDKKTDDYALYTLAICMLVGYWYENRGAVIIGSISKELEHSLTSIIVQLRSSNKI